MNSPSKRMWMTLDELGRSPDFASRVADEFPQGASVWPEGLSRRRFLQLMGASLALAGLNGCVRLPDEKIVPYTQQPEKLIPGNALHYATTLRVNGQPRGVIVTQHEGRPTHIAGNPLHPMSLGASDIWTTASILELYDPDRLKTVRHEGNVTSWGDFEQAMSRMRGQLAASAGGGLGVLTPPLTSPTELRLMQAFLSTFPQAKWYTHDPLAPAGPPSPEIFDLANYRAIFALEYDFLFASPNALANVRAFSERRRSDSGSDWNRLYVAESCPTVTGTKADHRFAVAPQDFDEFSQALLNQLRDGSRKNDKWPWLPAVADDLRNNGLILAGPTLSAAAREKLRQARSFTGSAPKESTSNANSNGPIASPLAGLVARMKSGDISTLILSQVNPVYDAPVDFLFGDLLAKVPLTISHVPQENETSAKCHWSLPAAHDLEVWGDTQAIDGTRSLVQPLIAPLYEGRSLIELLTLLTTGLAGSGYELVRETWRPPASSTTSLASPPGTSAATQEPSPSPDPFEANWHRWLRDGIITTSESANPSEAREPFQMSASIPPPTLAPVTLTLSFRSSPGMWDGRHANNGWLQELPDPITKLTWDNAAMMSPATAARWTLKDGDVVSLTAGNATIEAPVLVVPGHADLCITLPLGYGRSVCGSVGHDVGFNAYLLRRSDAPWFCKLDKLEPTGRTYPLAGTQEHFRMEARDLLHVSPVDQAPPVLAAVPPPSTPVPTLYPEYPYEGHKWALTIDLNSCIGCNACIIACQSENNIPVVGKEQVFMGREMQWIRVDRYYQGTGDNPRAHFQPVTCMQCENAPCEVVCPVAATQHDDEGLNSMIYNRCVGTRYCSNNCPYKVRRFNFLFYNADISESQRLRLNPNVTVRSRGVMEKCTYCIQRIEEARISARREHRPLKGSDVVTACQASCPAQAIAFGDLNEPGSLVARNRQKPGHYLMLEELNTRPRTTYLEKRINPNPALEPPANAI